MGKPAEDATSNSGSCYSDCQWQELQKEESNNERHIANDGITVESLALPKPRNTASSHIPKHLGHSLPRTLPASAPDTSTRPMFEAVRRGASPGDTERRDETVTAAHVWANQLGLTPVAAPAPPGLVSVTGQAPHG